MHKVTVCALSVARVCSGWWPSMRLSGMLEMNWISLSSCEKNTGSRPARPIGDQRHSPYGDTLNGYGGVGDGAGAAAAAETGAGGGVSHMIGPAGGPDAALWQPMHWSDVRKCARGIIVGRASIWSYGSGGNVCTTSGSGGAAAAFLGCGCAFCTTGAGVCAASITACEAGDAAAASCAAVGLGGGVRHESST